MDQDIYALVAKYGFKNLHIRLEEIMRDEYAYFQTKFQAALPVVKEVVPKKPTKLRSKKQGPSKPLEQTEAVVQSEVVVQSEEVEVKDVIVTVSEKANNFRDPKEMKEFQRNAVEAKKKENEAAGLSPSDFLTKDNLKQWIEHEGRTYAWVAREKAGCPETQVAATAQMMGLKSRISKKIGRVITGR
jgi:hypothetical protein